MQLPKFIEIVSSATEQELSKLQPLSTHAVASAEAHVRQHYALLLAATLASQPAISERQTRLLRLLLAAMGLGDIRAALFEQASQLDIPTVIEAARLLRESDLGSTLLIDLMVLLRAEQALDETSTRLIGELAILLGQGETTHLARLSETAAALLGMNGARLPHDVRPQDLQVWREGQMLTAERLTAGIKGGKWYVAHDLQLTDGWTMEDAVVEFDSGIKLFTTCDEKIEISIRNCELRNARIVMVRGEITLFVEHCRFSGEYPHDEAVNVLQILSGTLTVTDSYFHLPGACAIETMGQTIIGSCQFDHCGSPKLSAGALRLSSGYYNIKNCRFEGCTGSIAGAVITSDSHSISGCEFIACGAVGKNKIAVYIDGGRVVQKMEFPTLSFSTFQHCSLWINSGSSNDAYLNNVAFSDGNVFVPLYTSTCHLTNCLFENGSLKCER